MKSITICAIALLFACPSLTYSQDTSGDLDLATLSEKMDQLGAEMDGLGKIMDTHGVEMDKYGKEIEKSPENAPSDIQKKMGELGEKMGDLGEKMGKLGEQMGQYGEKMGALHRQMNDWFFRELKKDGLLASFEGKTRIIFDKQGLDVNGAKASEAQIQKYKSGFEKYWGRTLKPDFLFFFNGTLREKEGKIGTDGNMNTDF